MSHKHSNQTLSFKTIHYQYANTTRGCKKEPTSTTSKKKGSTTVPNDSSRASMAAVVTAGQKKETTKTIASPNHPKQPSNVIRITRSNQSIPTQQAAFPKAAAAIAAYSKPTIRLVFIGKNMHQRQRQTLLVADLKRNHHPINPSPTTNQGRLTPTTMTATMTSMMMMTTLTKTKKKTTRNLIMMMMMR